MTRVAKNKVHQARRKYLDRPESNLDRDRSLAALTMKEVNELVDRQPTASAEYVAKEGWEVLQSLSAQHQQIAVLLLRGRKHYQIAGQLHISEKTVGRVLKKLGMRLGLTPVLPP